MTWNIHGGIGPDGRLDMGRTLALIRRHKPDILAVQEVESRGRGLDHCGFTMLRDHIPGHSRPAETIRAQDGAYGHMLLSRWPIEHSELHDLSHPGREPRVAIEARIATPAGTLGVVSTHLGLRHRERAVQAAKLEAIVRRGGPTVVLGDFNEWSWRGPVWRALARQLPGHTQLRTFPARFPALKLDRIFCRPARLLGRNWLDRDARSASDHLPIIAELHMPGTS